MKTKTSRQAKRESAVSKKRDRSEYPDRRREIMTTKEAAKYLGVGIKTIGYLHWKFLNPEKAREDQIPAWMPEPLEGSKWTESGLYSAADIHELDTVLDATPRVVSAKDMVRRTKRRRRSKK